ncbi:hypothetical protein [Maribacter sp. 2304DJ31-5]|uniref:hypothetical protein n=1 Tax=Maribacter sp. 2304DJ31-5 TaxID=3386273 RepID=UPI0039BCA9A0
MSSTIKGKNTAIITYLTIIGAIIAISMNMEPKHDFAKFHIRQAFGIHLLFHAFAIFNSVWYNPYTLPVLYLCYFTLLIYGFLGVLNNKKQLIPVLGPYFQKWFTFIN